MSFHVNEIDDIALEWTTDDADAVQLVITMKGHRTRVRLNEQLIDKLLVEFDRVATEMAAETTNIIRGLR